MPEQYQETLIVLGLFSLIVSLLHLMIFSSILRAQYFVPTVISAVNVTAEIDFQTLASKYFGQALHVYNL